MTRYGVRVLAAASLLAMAGCGSESGSEPDGAGEQETSVSDSDQAAPDPSASDPTSAPHSDAATMAIEDLANRLGVAQTGIIVVRDDEVTWRDGSLGCPEPGRMYTQALVPGHRVVLEADGETYEYHAGGQNSAFLCENPKPPLER